MDDTINTDDPVAESPPTPPAPPAPPAEPVPQQTFEQDTSYRYSKSPVLAAFLAIVPGLGHLYVGAYQRAIMLVASFFAIIYLFEVPVDVFLCIFVWFFGLFDAYRMAQIADLGEEEIQPKAKPQSALSFGVFLTVAGLLLWLRTFWDIRFEWLREWWPMIPVAVGIYLIVASVIERAKKGDPSRRDYTLPEEGDSF